MVSNRAFFLGHNFVQLQLRYEKEPSGTQGKGGGEGAHDLT